MDSPPEHSPRALAARSNGRLGGRPRAAWAILDARDPRAVVYSAPDRAAIETWLHQRAVALTRTRKYYVRNPDATIITVQLQRAEF